MTNGEKNKKRFDELGLGGLPTSEIAHRIAVRKNGDVVLCELQTPCQDCIFKREHCIEDAEKWLTDEAEPEKPAQRRRKLDIMEDYKLRMINEYKELKGKYDRLHRMLVKYDAGKLDFTPTCPIDLLRKQASLMGQYLYVLETRAVIEGINLNAEGSESDEAADT